MCATFPRNARPKKRLRTNSVVSPQNSPASIELPEIINPQSTLPADRMQTTVGLSASLVLAQSNSSANTSRKMHAPVTENYTGLDDSRRDSHPSPNPNGKHQAPAQTIAMISFHTRPNYNIRHSSGPALVPPVSTNSLATVKDSVPFSESDIRERLRMSKVKERDIRAQLSKLSPDFSRALAATKSTTKFR